MYGYLGTINLDRVVFYLYILNKMKKFFEEYYEVSAQIEIVDKQNFDITLYDKDSKEKAKGSIVVGEATNSGTYFNNYLVD